MKGCFGRLAEFWTSQPLFRKIYVYGIFFIGSFAILGEFGEYVAGDMLQSGGQEFSSSQEVILWVVFTFIVAALEAYVLISFLKRVIGHFTSVIRRLAAGEQSARIGPEMADRNDELGLLARAFNTMAEQREQESAREKELLAAVSHELRSPLTRLSVSVELLRRENVPPEFLDRISLETERMEALIASILEYSRMEAGIQPFGSLDMAALVRDVADDVRFEGSVRGCEVEDHEPETLPLFGNAEMLRHAVENVLRNALRYTPDDGKISVRLTSEHGFCRLSVEDNGPGVPDSALSQIFRPFFRVDASRQRASGGAGMGLSISESAVRAHHGRLWAENRKEGGLMVVMELPLERVRDNA
ncbi:ATP-binding protein [uncultured Mailhella sp.]|uniref:sensor histidine kinase n=1 Tax=uncultured Mailhella sp. TaxID=1981031 RepID=UPI0025D583DB|nr:ATP-binding protein [uncultured Mailhella sp.]